jgi:hypothetical protein
MARTGLAGTGWNLFCASLSDRTRYTARSSLYWNGINNTAMDCWPLNFKYKLNHISKKKGK